MDWRTREASRLPRVVVALVALFLIACGIDVPQTDPQQPDEPRQPGAERSIDPQEFTDDINGAFAVAEKYWSGKIQGFRPVREAIAYRRDGEVSCGGQPLPRNNAVYCSDGDFIAYDVNWAAAAFAQIGDAFVYFLLGHEYAHGIQVRLGIQHQLTIEQELQADCMAGAYIGDSVRAGDLTLEDGDIEELRSGLLAVGDPPDQPWFEEGSHGSAKQRTDAFFSGYEKSLSACDIG